MPAKQDKVAAQEKEIDINVAEHVSVERKTRRTNVRYHTGWK